MPCATLVSLGKSLRLDLFFFFNAARSQNSSYKSKIKSFRPLEEMTAVASRASHENTTPRSNHKNGESCTFQQESHQVNSKMLRSTPDSGNDLIGSASPVLTHMLRLQTLWGRDASSPWILSVPVTAAWRGDVNLTAVRSTNKYMQDRERNQFSLEKRLFHIPFLPY